MFLKLVVALSIVASLSTQCFAAETDAVSVTLATCAADTGRPDCPATYQAVRASDCLTAGGNRACLIRKAREAAADNDCNRAYQLAYACQCESHQGSGRESIKAAGPAGVCKYLHGGQAR